jgi:hypothetical protein
MRADQLADNYYNDAEQDWVVYLSNQTVDPYYHWYLNTAEFQSYIEDKYGDLETPTQMIKYWTTNWVTDDSVIAPSYYDNTLPFERKKYYAPNYGQGSRIVSYARKQVDWVTNTNRIDQYDISYSSGNSFVEGELIFIHAGSSNASPTQGQAEVISSNTTTIIVKNISGNALANSTWSKTFVGNTSTSVATSNNLTNLVTNISNNESAFWQSVSWYDWEVQRNERRKEIQLLNPSVVLDVSNNIRKLLNQ